MSARRNTLRAVGTDQRTGLPVLEIPRIPKAQGWEKLQGTVVHYFGKVDLYSEGGAEGVKKEPRVLIITHVCVYIGTVQSVIENCYLHTDIHRLRQDPTQPTLVILNVDPTRNCDLVFEALDDNAYQGIAQIMNRLSEYHKQRPLLPPEIVQGGHLNEFINLKKPHGWRLQAFSLEPFQPVDERAEHEKGRIVQEEFERVKDTLRSDMSGYKVDEFEQVSRDIDLYLEMVEERDREIARLRTLRDTVFDDPSVWDDCPNCKHRSRDPASTTTTTINSLQRQIADCEHLLDHLQHSRANASRSVVKPAAHFSESSQVIHLKQKLRETNDKVKELRDIIVESPGCYPSSEARADALTRVGRVPVDAKERERQLALQAHDLDRRLAEKDKELRLTRSVMRESFQRQIEELNKLKESFDAYDQDIVEYLKQVFSGTAYPPGASAKHTPRELAQLTADAARASAVPVAIPAAPDPEFLQNADPVTGSSPARYLSTPPEVRSPGTAWLGSNLQPLSERLGGTGNSLSSKDSRKSIL